MLFRKIRNISFRMKMTIIFTIVCAFTTCISGILYYGFAAKEIVDNFTANAESLVTQMENTLDNRLEAVNRRAFAALTNQSFMRPLSDYAAAPDIKKEVALAGEAAYWLKDISRADSLVNSTMIYTDFGSWDDYTKARNWSFSFEDSVFNEVYSKKDADAIQWFPAMTDEIFIGNDQVIPYVRRFSIAGKPEKVAYLIIQLDQKVLMKELNGNAKKSGEILITDSAGRYIAGTSSIRMEDLSIVCKKETAQKFKFYSGDVQVNDETYLMYQDVLKINDWQICILKSKSDLLASIGNLRKIIIGSTAAIVAICLLLVAFFSKQLTSSLQRLTIQMNRVRSGELEARYYYPYKDEVGSLARSFNYMADQIEKSMKKQEEYIQVLKQERDFAEQIQKQKRKAELRALQAQINPHFLYNTLNTITWMASDKDMDEIRILSNSLGKFFRISLSKGAEVISVKDELEHIKSYLAIQEIRYAQVMTYQLLVSEELYDYNTLKLVLQPLVENAIYHGIKEKGSRCLIRISASKQTLQDGNEVLCFTVFDNGVGIAPEKCAEMNRKLQAGSSDHRDGYGIYNVNERIKLYYGEQFGLSYESEAGNWTKAILVIPAQMNLQEE